MDMEVNLSSGVLRGRGSLRSVLLELQTFQCLAHLWDITTIRSSSMGWGRRSVHFALGVRGALGKFFSRTAGEA